MTGTSVRASRTPGEEDLRVRVDREDEVRDGSRIREMRSWRGD